MVSARMLTLAVLAPALACNPPKEAHDSAPTPALASASASAPAPALAPASAPGACASDDDCSTWSSYCSEAPCACRVLTAGAPTPTCLTAGKVKCFVDPCMHKAARCQSGACVLTAK